MGCCIKALEPNPSRQTSLLVLALQVSLAEFNDLVAQAQTQLSQFTQAADMMRHLINHLRILSCVAERCGSCFIQVMEIIFGSLRDFYQCFSDRIHEEIRENSVDFVFRPHVRLMRMAKREILKLLENFVKNTTHLKYVADVCMPPIYVSQREHYGCNWNETGGR